MRVELHDFFRGARTAVGDRGRISIAPFIGSTGELCVRPRIFDLAVGEAVTEGIERAFGMPRKCALYGSTRPAGSAGRCSCAHNNRAPVPNGREARRKAPRRAVSAEQHVRDRIACLGPKEPGRKDCGRVQDRAFESECTAVLKDDDDRLADGGDSFGERCCGSGTTISVRD